MSEGLEVQGVNLARGGKAVLHDVDVTLERGKITALLGANGAGKSSLVLGIAGALPVASGADRPRRASDRGTSAGSDPRARRRRGAGRPSGARRPQRRGQSQGRRQPSAARRAQAGHRDCAGYIPGAPRAPAVALGHDVRRPAADAGLGAGDHLAPALSACRRTVVRPGAGGRRTPRSGTAEARASRASAILLIEQFTHIALKIADVAYVMERGQDLLPRRAGRARAKSRHPAQRLSGVGCDRAAEHDAAR